MPNLQRKHIHTRRIVCQALERDDGLWDGHEDLRHRARQGRAVAARHVDTPDARYDTQLVICGIQSAIDAHPQSTCPHAVNPMQELIGLKIGAGRPTEVRRRIGGALGCTHLRELLAP